MQTPDGDLIPMLNEEAAENIRDRLEGLTGKPHPVFKVGQVVEINGGKWEVKKIMDRGRMMLKAVEY